MSGELRGGYVSGLCVCNEYASEWEVRGGYVSEWGDAWWIYS